jgi:5-methylcytosine-specific restriction protein A
MPWRNSPADRRRSGMAYGAAYRRKRDECMRLANWRCQVMLPGICIGAASQCDHIVAVADGGGHELTNLRAVCDPCHKARTAQQGGGFRRGGGTREDPACQPRTAW